MGDPITVIGNIATDPERRQTATGLTVAAFRIASTLRRFDSDTSTWIDVSTNWYSVYAYRALAENALESLHKGERIIVAGKLKLRTWEKDGKRGTAVELIADAIGHDLRWGTSRYAKAARASETPTSGEAWDPGAQESDSAQTWADDGSAAEVSANAESALVTTPF